MSDALNLFEAAWLHGEKPQIQDYLVDHATPDFIGQLAALDLSFRVHDGEAKRVEDYLSQFDCLRSLSSWILVLVSSEYAERIRRGEDIDPAEYFKRFPDLASSLWLKLGIEPPLGTRIAQFEILEVLGRGSFGIVCGAKDHQLERIVALKLPRSTRYFDAIREAQSASVLRHWGIAQVYQVIESATCPALVSEFVPGETLDNRIRNRPLSFHESAQVISSVADAVDYAHRYGVYHDDLKPANILIRAASLDPVIVDFGLARRSDLSDHTVSGVGGTPAYMAPERFDLSLAIDKQTRGQGDVYSVGVALYELLVGHNRFHEQVKRSSHHQTSVCSQSAGINRSCLASKCWGRLPRPRHINREIPADLEAICLRAIETDLSKRYATASEMGDDLKRWLNSEPIPWLHPNYWHSAMWVRRNPLLTLSTAMLVTLIVTMLLAWSSLVAVLRQERTSTDLHRFFAAAAIHKSQSDREAAVERANQAETDLQASLRWLLCDLQPTLVPGGKSDEALLAWAEEQLTARTKFPPSWESLDNLSPTLQVPSLEPAAKDRVSPDFTSENYATNEGLLALVCKLRLAAIERVQPSDRNPQWEQRRSAWLRKAARCREAIVSQTKSESVVDPLASKPPASPLPAGEPPNWLGTLIVNWIAEHEEILPVRREDSFVARLIVVLIFATGLGTIVAAVLLSSVWLAGRLGYAYSIASWYLPKGMSNTNGIFSKSLIGVILAFALFYMRICGKYQVVPDREETPFPPSVHSKPEPIDVEQLLQSLQRENAEFPQNSTQPDRPENRSPSDG